MERVYILAAVREDFKEYFPPISADHTVCDAFLWGVSLISIVLIKIKGFAELRFRLTPKSIGQIERKKNIQRVFRNISPRKQFSEMVESIMGRMEYVVIKANAT